MPTPISNESILFHQEPYLFSDANESEFNLRASRHELRDLLSYTEMMTTMEDFGLDSSAVNALSMDELDELAEHLLWWYTPVNDWGYNQGLISILKRTSILFFCTYYSEEIYDHNSYIDDNYAPAQLLSRIENLDVDFVSSLLLEIFTELIQLHFS